MNTNQTDIICRSSFLPHQMILSMQPVTSARSVPLLFFSCKEVTSKSTCIYIGKRLSEWEDGEKKFDNIFGRWSFRAKNYFWTVDWITKNGSSWEKSVRWMKTVRGWRYFQPMQFHYQPCVYCLAFYDYHWLPSTKFKLVARDVEAPVNTVNTCPSYNRTASESNLSNMDDWVHQVNVR